MTPDDPPKGKEMPRDPRPEDFSNNLEDQTLLALFFREAREATAEERELEEQMTYLEREGAKIDAMLPGLPISGELIENIRAGFLRVKNLMLIQIQENNGIRHQRQRELAARGLWTPKLVDALAKLYPNLDTPWRDRMADRVDSFVDKYFKYLNS